MKIQNSRQGRGVSIQFPNQCTCKFFYSEQNEWVSQNQHVSATWQSILLKPHEKIPWQSMGATHSPGCPSGHGPGLGTPEDSLFMSLRAPQVKNRGVLSIREQHQGKKQETGMKFRKWVLAQAECPIPSQTDSQFWPVPGEDFEPFEDGTQPTHQMKTVTCLCFQKTF